MTAADHIKAIRAGRSKDEAIVFVETLAETTAKRTLIRKLRADLYAGGMDLGALMPTRKRPGYVQRQIWLPDDVDAKLLAYCESNRVEVGDDSRPDRNKRTRRAHPGPENNPENNGNQNHA